MGNLHRYELACVYKESQTIYSLSLCLLISTKQSRPMIYQIVASNVGTAVSTSAGIT